MMRSLAASGGQRVGGRGVFTGCSSASSTALPYSRREVGRVHLLGAASPRC